MDQDDIDSLFSDYEHDPSDYDDSDVTCKRCGKDGLYWIQVQGGKGTRYQLIDDATGQHHHCNVMQEDEFEDLS